MPNGVIQSPVDRDLRRNMLLNFRVENRTTSPNAAGSVEGLLYYDSNSAVRKLTYCVDGSVPTYVTVPRPDSTETVSGLWTFSRSGAPFAVSNSTVVTNLNADKVDGFNASVAVNNSTVAVRDTDGTLKASDPVDSDDLVTKGFAEQMFRDRDVKDPVVAATTGNVNLSSPGASIDGVTLSSSSNDRVLLKDQSTGSENGVWIFNGASSAMTRAADVNADSEVSAGLQVFVLGGTTHGGGEFTLQTADPITVGSTSLSFVQTGGQSIYSAGNGLVKSGNTFHFAQSSSYTAGALPYANGTSTIGFIQAAATGNVLKSAGTGQSPVYGKVDVTSDITGVIPTANGGTGSSTQQPSGRILITGGNGVYTTDTELTYDSSANKITSGSAQLNHIGLGVVPDTTYRLKTTGKSRLYNTTDFALLAETTGSNTAIFNATSTPPNYIVDFRLAGNSKVRIEPDGDLHAVEKIGVGLGSPTYDVHVQRMNARIAADNGTVETLLQADSTIGYVGTNTNHKLILKTNNTSRLEIDGSTGDVKVISKLGVNTSPVSLATATVNGTLQATFGHFTGWAGNGDTGTGLGLDVGVSGGKGYVMAYNRTSSSYADLRFVSAGGNTGLTLLSASGDVGCNTIAPSTKFHIYDSTSNTTGAARTSVIDTLTVETHNTGSTPYAGFGQGIVFRGTTYNNTSNRILGRIAHVIRDHSNATSTGTALRFQTQNNPGTTDAPVTQMEVGTDVEITNKLGIGVSPVTALDIQGSTNTNTKIKLTNTNPSTDNVWSMHANYSDQSLRFMGDSDLVLGMYDDGWLKIGASQKDFARQSNFGYTSGSYKVLQLGTCGSQSGIAIGVDVSTNASGSFSGDEIIFPNQKKILTPNSGDDSYLGIWATDSANKLRIGNYRFNILNDTPGITIDLSSASNSGQVTLGNLPTSTADNSLIVESSGLLKKRTANSGIWTTDLGANRFLVSNSSGGFFGHSSFVHLGGRVSLTGAIDSGANLKVDIVDHNVSSNDTNYEKAIYAYAGNGYNIASGVTDSGYRIAVDASAFVSDSDFEGTLNNQYAVWARHGAYSSASGSGITNSYGVFIDTLTNSNTTISNLYAIYQNSSAARNYFAGSLGIGATPDSTYKLIVNGKSKLQNDIVFSSANPRIDFASTSSGIRLYSTTSNAEKLRLTDSGLKLADISTSTSDTNVIVESSGLLKKRATHPGAFGATETQYSTNLNSVSGGWYKWGSSSNKPVNGPGHYMVMLQQPDSNQDIQLAYGGSSYGKLFIRRADSGTFYDWTEFYSTENLTLSTLGGVGGSGTVGKIPLWSGNTTTLGDSVITQSGTARVTVSAGLVVSGDYTDIGNQLNLWCDSSGHGYAAVYDFAIKTGGNNSRTTKWAISNTGEITSGPTGYKIKQTYSNGNNSALLYSLTTGNLELRGGSTDYAQLYLKSGGNVGINIDDPDALIHISGASNGTQTYALFSTGPANGDQNLHIQSSSSRDHMALQVKTGAGAVDDLSLNPDGGNVGINCTPNANYKLDVDGAGRFTTSLRSDGYLTIASDTAEFYIANAAISKFWRQRLSANGTEYNLLFDYNDGTGNITPLTLSNTGHATFSGTITSTDNANGSGDNIVVSTTNKDANLYAISSKRSGTTVGGMRIDGRFRAADGSATTPAYAFTDDANTGMFRAGSDHLQFVTGGTSRLEITNAGNVGINCTPDTNYKLDVNGDARIGGNRTATSLLIEASDDNGAPSYTSIIKFKGYESRAQGIFFENSTYTGEEWFAGLQYGGAFNAYVIGWDQTGSQAEYDANYKFKVTTGGSVYTQNSYYAGDGNTTYPSFSFRADPNTGMFRAGADHLQLIAGGAGRLKVAADVSVIGSTDLLVTGANRRLSFTSGTGTVRTTTAAALYFATNNTNRLEITSSGHVIPSYLKLPSKTLLGSNSMVTGLFEFSNETNARLYFTRSTGNRARIAQVYETTIGDGSATSFTVNHNLGGAPAAVTMRDTSSGEYFEVDWSYTNANNITVSLQEVATSNEYTVTIVA